MSSYKKNIMVGVTTLLALALLGWMILKFGDRPAKLFAPPQLPIHFVATQATGISEGSPIQYLGINAGRVSRIRLAENRRSIIIDALVDVQKPPLPANVEGIIVSQLVGGSSSISLVVPAGQAPRGAIEAGQELTCRYVGVDIFPPEFSELAAELSKTSRQLRETNFVAHLDEAVVTARKQMENVGTTLASATRVLESVNGIVGDEALRKDIRASIANFRTATETATRVAEDMEKLARSANKELAELSGAAKGVLTDAQARLNETSKLVGDRLLQVSKLLENLDSVSRKLNEGKGSAALLLNDPRLYEGLADTSKLLSLTVQDLRRLVQQWEQEGVYLKLSDKK